MRRKLLTYWALNALASLAVVWLAIDVFMEKHVLELAALALVTGLLFTASIFYARATSQTDRVREEESRRRLLMDQASDAIFISDLDGRFVEVNAEACRLTGLSADRLIGMTIQELTSPEEMAALELRMEEVPLGSIHRFERSLHRTDGVDVEIEVTTSAVADRIIAVARDVTAKKENERALEQREELFRAVSEMTSDYAIAFRVEPDGGITTDWATGAYEEVTGYRVDEVVPGGWQAAVHPDDVPALAATMKHYLSEGGSWSSEFRIITKTGESKRVRSWTRAVRDETGRITRLIGAVSDVTAQRELEEELARSQVRYKELYETIPVGIYTRRWDGVGIGCNPAAVEMFGFPDAETFLAHPPDGYYLNPEDRVDFLETLERDGVLREYDVLLKKFDGTPMWARNTSHLVRDANGTPLYYDGALIDITEQKTLEQELRHALATVSKADAERRRLVEHLVRAKEEERRRVASDIHDDTVQVMTSVAISLERLVRNTAEATFKSELETVEDSVRAAIHRLRGMVFELRPPSLDEDGLVAALTLYLEEMQIETGIHYEIDNQLDSEPSGAARVALYRIAQEALVNVRKHSGAKNVRLELCGERDGVKLSVMDDGSGFDPLEIAPNPGHIGLGEMRERAELADGTIRIDRAPTGGTLVEVWLPDASVAA
jgi:PAS domain S-box-containing protein